MAYDKYNLTFVPIHELLNLLNSLRKCDKMPLEHYLFSNLCLNILTIQNMSKMQSVPIHGGHLNKLLTVRQDSL